MVLEKVATPVTPRVVPTVAAPLAASVPEKVPVPVMFSPAPEIARTSAEFTLNPQYQVKAE